MKHEKNDPLPCCQVDEVACRDCRYFGQPYCSSVAMKDAMEKIRQLEEAVALMKIQMHGDCGVCKHKDDAEKCVACLFDHNLDHPHWEYEGLPEV